MGGRSGAFCSSMRVLPCGKGTRGGGTAPGVGRADEQCVRACVGWVSGCPFGCAHRVVPNKHLPEASHNLSVELRGVLHNNHKRCVSCRAKCRAADGQASSRAEPPPPSRLGGWVGRVDDKGVIRRHDPLAEHRHAERVVADAGVAAAQERADVPLRSPHL